MEPTIKTSGDVAVLHVDAGTLDASNSREFKTKVTPIVESNRKVLIDMSSLEFVDSTGLGALVSCLKAATAAGGDLRLCSVRKPVRTLFELTRMHRVFSIYNSLDEAVAAYQG